MRLFLAVSAVLLVTCHAMPDLGNVDQDSTFDDSVKIVYKGGQLVGALEKFKDIMRNGNSSLGLPVLDPLQQEHLDVNFQKAGLVSVQGTVDHLQAAGLSNYKINRGDFSLIGIAVNIDLSWDEIALVTQYNLKGTLLDDMSFFGDGNIELDVRDLRVTVDLNMSVKDRKLVVSKLTLHVYIKELDLKITGLFDDDDTSAIISRIISDIAPGLIVDYQEQLSQYASPIVANLLNNVLKDYTLKDLLDMITG